MWRRKLWFAAGMAATLGCREDAGPPTAPEDGVALTAAATTPLAFRQVDAGSHHACGVTTDDRAYCWGANSFGNLGDGTANFRSTPVLVLGGLSFIDVRAGITHTCGLTEDLLAYCWGQNDLGQLGDGNGPAGRGTPVAVAGGRRFSQIRVGFRHTCALTPAGVAFCWGENVQGQLGSGSITGPQDCSGVACSLRPIRVSGGHSFRQIRAGGEHTCGLTADRRAYCWGNNIFGQLGDRTIVPRTQPVAVAGGLLFRQLSAGGTHSCGVTQDERAYCWGRNRDGQIGSGYVSPRRRQPTEVVGGLRFGTVQAGLEHTCGLTTGNAAYCWGKNVFGQLGDGTRVNRPAPVAVAGGLRFASVAAGWTLSCGVTTGTRGYCWGTNAAGQLGDGTNADSPVPVAVAAPM